MSAHPPEEITDARVRSELAAWQTFAQTGSSDELRKHA